MSRIGKQPITVPQGVKAVIAGQLLKVEGPKGKLERTLRSEIDRLHQIGKHVVFDVDVKGALNIKQLFPKETLSVFIKVPSMEVLEERLRARGTETEESLHKRLVKARHELTYEEEFDAVLINDDLNRTLAEAGDIVRKFLI